MSGGDVLNGNPFSTGRPEDRIGAVQNYFAEYHLVLPQRLYGDFPSRLHARLFFATRTDAESFRTATPRYRRKTSRLRAQHRRLCRLVPRRELARLPAPAAQPEPRRSTRSPAITGADAGRGDQPALSRRRWREPAVIEALSSAGLATHSLNHKYRGPAKRSASSARRTRFFTGVTSLLFRYQRCGWKISCVAPPFSAPIDCSTFGRRWAMPLWQSIQVWPLFSPFLVHFRARLCLA